MMSAVHREHKLSASIRSILSPKTGPSGAEKTMLLRVLSGRPTSNAKFTVQAQVCLNQTLVDPTDIYIRHKIVSLKTTPSPTPAHITPLECLLFFCQIENSMQHLLGCQAWGTNRKDAPCTRSGGMLPCSLWRWWVVVAWQRWRWTQAYQCRSQIGGQSGEVFLGEPTSGQIPFRHCNFV